MIVYVTPLINGELLAQFLRPSGLNYDVVRVVVSDPGLVDHLRLTAALGVGMRLTPSSAAFSRDGRVSVTLPKTESLLSNHMLVQRTPDEFRARFRPTLADAELLCVIVGRARGPVVENYRLVPRQVKVSTDNGLLCWRQFGTLKISEVAEADPLRLFRGQRSADSGIWFNSLLQVGLAHPTGQLDPPAAQDPQP